MTISQIIIKGASEHNLKNIDVTLPRDKFIIITGPSGSGKSSLAFDTIYAEGQRRYVESLSAYARQFLGQMEKPHVEYIEGLSPAISIEQKTTSKNPRSIVGTVTEIYDYMRLLFARIGKAHCHQCGREIAPQTIDEIIETVTSLPEDTKVHVLAPIVKDRKGEYIKLFEELRADGFVRARVDGEIRDLGEDIELGRYQKHTIELVVDRLVIKGDIKQRLTDSVEIALEKGNGIVIMDVVDGKEMLFSEHMACVECGIGFEKLEPSMFSFNNPSGACEKCHGLGTTMEFDPELVIPNDTLSISEGAIEPWSGPGSYYMQMLNAVADEYGFSLNDRFCDLSQFQKTMILYGTDREIKFSFVPRTREGLWEYKNYFEGVITNLMRRYRESTSEDIRDRLVGYMSIKPCTACEGLRLKPHLLAVTIDDRSIMDVTHMPIKEAQHFFSALSSTLTEQEIHIASLVLKEINARLGFLMAVGLDYLTLDRSSGTLSGGEAQRIRLATQIGSSLVGVLYILDEPSIGLHPRDNAKLIEMLKRLRDIGNTVIVVEHDEETMMNADWIVDMGPGAGELGGEVVVAGPPAAIIAHPTSTTGQYLSRRRMIEIPGLRRKPKGRITITGARQNNLQNIDVEIPLGVMCVVTGVSGSGKSTLINDILSKSLARTLHKARVKPGEHDAILGIEQIDNIITIDQSPIGRTPRSNPATYTKVFTTIRDIFAKLQASKVLGYMPGRFSFNVKGGRCEACSGDGIIKIEMHFLPDVYVQCEVCKGKRYNNETLNVRYKDKSIADVLDMTVTEALALFANIPVICKHLQTLYDVGLGYIKLGQPATTLSGGEAQRVKLSTELSKRSTGRTLYILDEPTTGLHFADVHKLLDVLQKLVDNGNTVVIIEHNLDVIKCADWIIDLGPEGGDKGGMKVAEGTPEHVATVAGSYTGQFLEEILGA